MGFSILCKQCSKHNVKVAVCSRIESQRYFKHNFVTLNDAVSCWEKLFKTHSTEVDILKIKLLSRHSEINKQSTRTKHSVLFLCHSCFATYPKDKLSFGITTGNVSSERIKVLDNEINFSYSYTNLVCFGWKRGLKFVIPCYFKQVNLSLHPLKQDLWDPWLVSDACLTFHNLDQYQV